MMFCGNYTRKSTGMVFLLGTIQKRRLWTGWKSLHFIGRPHKNRIKTTNGGFVVRVDRISLPPSYF